MVTTGKPITLSDFKDLKSWRPWTKEDERRLRELFLAKKTDKQIGEIMARSWQAVQIRRSKIGATSWRNKKSKTKIKPVLAGGGKAKELSLEALKTTQTVLKSLGYRLVITKLEQ